MIILRHYFRGKSKRQQSISGKVIKKLEDGKYNGYCYIQAVKNPLPGHERVVRIGETARSAKGLNTYRPVRGLREWKQEDKGQTNMIGKYYKREDIVTFIFPTKLPYAQKILESQFKQKFYKKYGKSPAFDLDGQLEHLIDNDEWTNLNSND
jgi:hypothetical protein